MRMFLYIDEQLQLSRISIITQDNNSMLCSRSIHKLYARAKQDFLEVGCMASSHTIHRTLSRDRLVGAPKYFVTRYITLTGISCTRYKRSLLRNIALKEGWNVRIIMKLGASMLFNLVVSNVDCTIALSLFSSHLRIVYDLLLYMYSLGQLRGLKPRIVLTYIDIDAHSRAQSARVLVTESLIYNVGKYNKCAVPIVRRTGCASYTDL